MSVAFDLAYSLFPPCGDKVEFHEATLTALGNWPTGHAAVAIDPIDLREAKQVDLFAINTMDQACTVAMAPRFYAAGELSDKVGTALTSRSISASGSSGDSCSQMVTPIFVSAVADQTVVLMALAVTVTPADDPTQTTGAGITLILRVRK
jgi:hypothetical protein